jgi:hypothetical protein
LNDLFCPDHLLGNYQDYGDHQDLQSRRCRDDKLIALKL